MGREERKVVTILFTDLVGFTSRAEELDPEDVRAMLSPYYARLRAQIEKRGGTVEKFIGDAVMAVFGAPVAHEDDPVRAVLTALAIRDSTDDLEIRTAVNTGEALVALDADPAAGESFVSGDVVNTAARLQSAAPVNGILVGEATYRATRHVIDYREAPAVEAKGKSQPVAVWEVVAARPRFGTDVEQTHRSELVGRDREVLLLTDAFARCRSEETAQLVTLVGVPGIGKSRLVAELFTVLDNDPNVYWWRQGRSLPYGESRSVWALGEIVKAQVGVLESDDAATARAKLADAVAELLPEEEERRWVESHLHALAGVAGEADESQDRRVEAFSAWRRFFEALAEQRPLVLVFEDLHWADDTLLDFVDHLAEWASGVPLLIVCTARPELLDRRPGWGGGKRNSTTLSIGALSNDDTAKLLPILPADLQQLVLERAEGNPLYAAEYARMLAENPGGEVTLPETVQGLIAARIDQLPPEEKSLVQDASVLGKVFWPSALDAASDDALHALERKEFVRRDRRSSVAGEQQYAFLHLLVRDVAYGQIPRARRMAKHQAAAEWLESLSPDRSEDHAEMLAHHYREALRLAQASGVDTIPFREPALAALVGASERAAGLSSWSAAVELATEALALAEDGDPRRPGLQLRLARGKGFGPAGAADVGLAASARDGFLAAGDVEQAAEAEAFLAWAYWWRGDGEPAGRHADAAVELVRDLPTSVSKARAYARAGRLEAIGGDPARGVELADATFAMAEELDRDDLRSDALNTRGIAKDKLADVTSVDDLRRSVELADASNVPREMATSRNNLASVLMSGLGRMREAMAIWEESRDTALRFGSAAGVQWPTMALMVSRLVVGEFDAALAAADALEAETAEGTQVHTTVAFVRARVHAFRGELDQAVPLARAGLERSRLVRDPQAIAPAMSTLVHACLFAGLTSEANAVVDEMLSVREYIEPAMTADAALMLVELGRAADYLAAAERFRPTPWADAGRAIAAGDFVRGAEVYDEIGTLLSAAWARLLAAERGDLSQLEPARAFFVRAGATPFVTRCDAVLAVSA